MAYRLKHAGLGGAAGAVAGVLASPRTADAARAGMAADTTADLCSGPPKVPRGLESSPAGQSTSALQMRQKVKRHHSLHKDDVALV